MTNNSDSISGKPTAAPAATSDLRYSVACLVTLAVLGAMVGFRSAYPTVPSFFDLVYPFALAICVGTWGLHDARRRGRPVPLLAQTWFVLFATLTVPAYLIWSRKWWGVGCVLFGVLLWCAAIAAGFVVGTELIYGGNFSIIGPA